MQRIGQFARFIPAPLLPETIEVLLQLARLPDREVVPADADGPKSPAGSKSGAGPKGHRRLSMLPLRVLAGDALLCE